MPHRLAFAVLLLASGARVGAAQQDIEATHRRQCEAGEIASCTLLGLIYETGAGGERDPDRALELYRRACDFGVGPACTRLALIQRAPATADVRDELMRVGLIADAETGEPIAQAVVELPALGVRVVADEAGRVDLGGLPRGRHRIIAARFGYGRVDGDLPVPWETDFLLLLERVSAEGEATLGRIFGRVTDAGTGQGLPYVDVTLGDGVTRRALTSQDGRFALTGLQPGEVDVTFSIIGYAPRTTTVVVQGGGTLEVRAALSTEPIQLEPIDVTVGSEYLERSGFYQRTRLAIGTQWTRGDLREFEPLSMADVLRRTPGVGVTIGRGGTRAVSSRAGIQGSCRLRPYLDGVAVYDLDLDYVRMDDLEAIEVYHHPNAPIEYSRLMDPDGVYPCGVVLIWSRRGR